MCVMLGGGGPGESVEIQFTPLTPTVPRARKSGIMGVLSLCSGALLEDIRMILTSHDSPSHSTVELHLLASLRQ